MRARIGLVFQDPSLDQQLTARENLEFHAFIYDVPAGLRKARIDEVLEMVELADRADAPVQTFSGGMRRRLEIARGILHTPDVLFLDEPTIGLDPQTRRHIWAYLSDLPKRAGVTIFMTTHYMDEAEYCDRIAIIDHGEIQAIGTPDELKSMVGGDVVTITTGRQRCGGRADRGAGRLSAGRRQREPARRGPRWRRLRATPRARGGRRGHFGGLPPAEPR